MCSFIIEAIGFVVNISRTNSEAVTGSLIAVSTCGISIFVPGLITFAITRPMATASTVVSKYRDKVFSPQRPIFLASSTEAVPETIDENTNGTINMVSNDRKIFPTRSINGIT